MRPCVKLLQLAAYVYVDRSNNQPKKAVRYDGGVFIWVAVKYAGRVKIGHITMHSVYLANITLKACVHVCGRHPL